MSRFCPTAMLQPESCSIPDVPGAPFTACTSERYEFPTHFEPPAPAPAPYTKIDVGTTFQGVAVSKSWPDVFAHGIARLTFVMLVDPLLCSWKTKPLPLLKSAHEPTTGWLPKVTAWIGATGGCPGVAG